MLDRATYEVKKDMANKLSQVIYEGKWFTPLREAIQAFIESTQEYVTGEVKFKLYKGNITKAGTTSPYSLYSESWQASPPVISTTTMTPTDSSTCSACRSKCAL